MGMYVCVYITNPILLGLPMGKRMENEMELLFKRARG